MLSSRIPRPSSLIHKDQDRLVLWLPVFFGLGIGLYFALPTEPSIGFTLAICTALSIAIWIFWKSSFGRLLFISLLLITLGTLRAEIHTMLVSAPVLYKQIFFRPTQGRIADIKIKERGEKIILTDVKIEGIKEKYTPKRISISLKKVDDNIMVGDLIKIPATLFPPPTPVMPEAYDFSRMFYYQQLGAVGYSPRKPVILEKANTNETYLGSFEQWINTLRLSITQRILAPMTTENGWIAAALMVGEQSGVNKEVSDVMRNSGIYHVLSISGLHMSIAAMLVFLSARFLLSLYPPLALRVSTKKISAIVALISSFAYLLLAGYPVPATRSFIMVAAVMTAILFDRSGISIFSIAWAAVIVLLWQPESVLGASFQLSFSATLGIIAFYERFGSALFKPNIGFRQKIWLYFLGIMLTSLVATLATTPLVVYHFNRYTIWGIAANMLLMPLVSMWIMPAAVIVFILMPFGLEYYPLIALDSGISLMMHGARMFSELPYSSIPITPPSFFGIIMAVFGGLWLIIWQQKWRCLGIPIIIIGVSTIWLHKPYDLLISSNGSKVAARLDDGNFLFVRGKDNSFDGQVWLRSHGKEKGFSHKDMDESKGRCDKHKCTFKYHGKKIVATKGKKEIESSCDGNPYIVISQNYLDRIAGCTNVPLLFDKAHFRANGATALRFNNSKIQIKTSKEFRGNRPWVN